jgi:hypothetical protein
MEDYFAQVTANAEAEDKKKKAPEPSKSISHCELSLKVPQALICRAVKLAAI